MEEAKILEGLEKGDIKPYQLEELLWDKKKETWAKANRKAAELRLRFLERKLGKSFPSLERFYVEVSSARENPTTGIESQIGGAAVPLGVAGPVQVRGKSASGEFWLPIATNEAALIAGLNRGCKLINKVGGVKSVVTRDYMARAPALMAGDLETAARLVKEIGQKGELYQKVKEVAEAESRVSRLTDIVPFQMGRVVHLRFHFQTGDAMGMNSATKYAANGVRELLKRFPGVKLVSLTGNLCTDKKATHINVLLGRGKTVETEAEIPGKLIQEVYGISAADMARLNSVKNYQGSALAGTVTGFNGNVANTIAGLFVATGQDCAQIVESSSCFTRAELVGDGLLFGVTLPSLEVATIGGGTGFGTAPECLDMLGCRGPGKEPGDNARKLAEIIAAAVTAQELNLLGAQANEYELAESHIRLARGK